VSLGRKEPDVSPDFHEYMLGGGGIKTGSAADQVNLMLIGIDLLIDTLVELSNGFLQIPQVFEMYSD
jgi:hypothetical protein